MRRSSGALPQIEGPKGAPAVVLISSIGMDRSLWREQMPVLRQFRVVRFEQRGHGSDPVPPGPYSIADLGSDVVDILDDFELQQSALCGLSLGGLVAMWVAAHVPERVSALATACTSAFPGDPQKWATRAGQVRAGELRSIAVGNSERWFTPPFAATHQELLAELRGIVASNSSEGYAACCEALRDADLRDDLVKITAPTLVIAGTQDLAFPRQHAVDLRDRIAGAELVEIEAAHIANLEAPDAFNAALLRLLAGVHGADDAENVERV
ncbi:MAG TPA: 3-oxoadipate enol-lactonase [Acidothermaceae bacterium]|jgi:3-oxoadipate enol-lactonase